MTASPGPNLLLWCTRRLLLLVLPLCFVMVSLFTSPVLASEPQGSVSIEASDCPFTSAELVVDARRAVPIMHAYISRLSDQPWGQGLAKQGKKVDETPESEVKRTVIGCSPRHGSRSADADPHHPSHVGTVDQVARISALLPGVPAGRAPPLQRAD